MLKIKLMIADGFSKSQKEKLEKAVNLFEASINSDLFKEKVLNFSWGGGGYYVGRLWWKRWVETPKVNCFSWNYRTAFSSQGVSFVKNQNMTNEQVYREIMKGQSLYESDGNSQIEIEITLANQRGVLGWTYPNKLMTWISQWFFDSSEVYEIAGNLSHEAMHKLGFDHSFKATYDRPYTVPYAIGNFIEDISKKLSQN